MEDEEESPSAGNLKDNGGQFTYYSNLKEAMSAVEKHAEYTDTTFAMLKSDIDFGNGMFHTFNDYFKVRWAEGDKAIGEPIPFDGIPFFLLGTRHLGCQYLKYKGPDTLRKKRGSRSKKQEKCPAKIVLKEVIKFPDYKVNSWDKKDMVKSSQSLRADLKSKSPLMETRIYVEFPDVTAHSHSSLEDSPVDSASVDHTSYEKDLQLTKSVSKLPNNSCLVCSVRLSPSARAVVDIYSKTAKTSHRCMDVHKALSHVLHEDLRMKELQSTTICSRCFHLLDDIDSLEFDLMEKKKIMTEKYAKTKRLAMEEFSSSDKGDSEFDDDNDELYGERCHTKSPKRKRPVGRPKRRGPGRPRGRPKSLDIKKSLKVNRSPLKMDPDSVESSTQSTSDTTKFAVKTEDDGTVLPTSILRDESSTTVLKTIKKETSANDKENGSGDEDMKGDSIATELDVDDTDAKTSGESDIDVFDGEGEELDDNIKKKHLYACSECDQVFDAKAELKSHLKIHTQKSSYTCIDCGETITDRKSFWVHRRKHKEMVHSCPFCKKSCVSLKQYKKHMKTSHSEITLYDCNLCGKSLTTAKTLELHMMIHTGEKPYQCELCGATFRQRSNLHFHIKATHLQEKNHACEICHKTFARKRLLVYHMHSAHTGERPYKCDICGNTFVYPHHYKRHLGKHSGDKPFKCTICSKQFRSRASRNEHLFTHSNKRPYECKVCGAGYMRKPLCLNHVSSHSYTDNPEDLILFTPPSKMLKNTEDQKPEESIPADYEMERAVRSVTVEGGNVAETEDEFFTLRDDKVVKVMSRPVRIIKTEDRIRFVIDTSEGKSDNMDNYFASFKGHDVVEVQPEDF
ncbi:hypothetical protein SK128_006829 [Halocaridina rubra]|uniref:C2H2-type domain-containing protein n=1 Tax=Halocaridina rubra TaxID=373956 RepID=A0AAN8WJF4_HALRR